MKAQLITKSVTTTCSFSLTRHSFKNFLHIWHYHPQLELVIIQESTGMRFVGDSIESFKPGEIILIGKDLPHLWLNDKAYFESDNTEKRARALVIHFDENFGNGFFQIPEMSLVHCLLQKAKRGIKFSSGLHTAVVEKINTMFGMTDCKKVISFLELLRLLAEQQDYTLLSSAGYVHSFNEIRNSKMMIVYKYIMNNFKQDISLANVAELANMNPASFSRYFKNIHKSTFIRFLNEVRIGYACKLLIEGKYTIAEVGYESGYNNLSNFNRQFRLIKQMAPSEYTRMYATAH